MNIQKDFDNFSEATDYLFRELDYIAAVNLSTIGTLIASSYAAEFRAKGIDFDDAIIEEKTDNILISYINYYKKLKYIDNNFLSILSKYLNKLNIRYKIININLNNILSAIALIKVIKDISSDIEDLENKIMFNRSLSVRDFEYRYISFNAEDVYKEKIDTLKTDERSEDDFYMNLSDSSYEELDKFMRNLFKY